MLLVSYLRTRRTYIIKNKENFVVLKIVREDEADYEMTEDSIQMIHWREG